MHFFNTQFFSSSSDLSYKRNNETNYRLRIRNLFCVCFFFGCCCIISEIYSYYFRLRVKYTLSVPSAHTENYDSLNNKNVNKREH